MIIAGLDLSLTSAGVVILRDGRPITIRSVGHKGRDGDSWQHRSRRVRSQVQAVLRVVDLRCHQGACRIHSGTCACPLPHPTPDLAVIEGPLMHGPAQAYEFDRAALWHGVYGALEARRIPIAVVNPMTLKLWFTGAGDATKQRMCDTARLRFREPITTSDESDAIALATAGAFKVGDPIPWEPCERSVECLARVEWPVGVGR